MNQDYVKFLFFVIFLLFRLARPIAGYCGYGEMCLWPQKHNITILIHRPTETCKNPEVQQDDRFGQHSENVTL